MLKVIQFQKRKCYARKTLTLVLIKLTPHFLPLLINRIVQQPAVKTAVMSMASGGQMKHLPLIEIKNTMETKTSDTLFVLISFISK